MLLDARTEARNSIAFGLLILVSAIPIHLIAIWTNDTMLLLGTLYLPFAIVFGGKLFLGGIARHSHASFKLRQLHARTTSLPSARLVE